MMNNYVDYCPFWEQTKWNRNDGDPIEIIKIQLTVEQFLIKANGLTIITILCENILH